MLGHVARMRRCPCCNRPPPPARMSGRRTGGPDQSAREVTALERWAKSSRPLRTVWSPITRGTLFWPPNLPTLFSQARRCRAGPRAPPACGRRSGSPAAPHSPRCGWRARGRSPRRSADAVGFGDLPVELDDVGVTAEAPPVSANSSDGELGHLGADALGGGKNARLDQLAGEVLAERRQHVGGAAGDQDAAAAAGRRSGRCRRSCSSTARRRWSARWHSRRLSTSPSQWRVGLAAPSSSRHELVEQAVIGQQPGPRGPRSAMATKPSLAG